MAVVDPRIRKLNRVLASIWSDCGELQRCMILQDDLMGVRYKERDPRIDAVVVAQFHHYMSTVKQIVQKIEEVETI